MTRTLQIYEVQEQQQFKNYQQNQFIEDLGQTIKFLMEQWQSRNKTFGETNKETKQNGALPVRSLNCHLETLISFKRYFDWKRLYHVLSFVRTLI